MRSGEELLDLVKVADIAQWSDIRQLDRLGERDVFSQKATGPNRYTRIAGTVKNQSWTMDCRKHTQVRVRRPHGVQATRPGSATGTSQSLQCVPESELIERKPGLQSATVCADDVAGIAVHLAARVAEKADGVEHRARSRRLHHHFACNFEREGDWVRMLMHRRG
jgi:hypothetical protein